MQTMFLVLFGVSLVLFSLLVRECVDMLPYVLGGATLPIVGLARLSLWLVLFVASFFGTGLYLYERERDEGRIGRRIGFYDRILDRRQRPTDDPAPKAIRRKDAD